MIATIGFLAICLTMFLFPTLVYENRELRSCSIRMAYSEKHRLFCICLLGITIIAFHLLYYAANPSDAGIMVSTIFLFATLATKHTLSFLIAIRTHKLAIYWLGVATLLFAIIPITFTTAVTLGMMLFTTCVLPTEKQIRARSLRTARKNAENGKVTKRRAALRK